MKKNEISASSNQRKLFLSLNNHGDDSIVNLLPYKKCSEQGIIRKANIEYPQTPSKDLYQVFLSIKSTDLDSLNEGELAEWADTYTAINRVFSHPLKLVSLSRQAKATEPLRYWTQVNKAATNELAARNDIDRNLQIRETSLEVIDRLKSLEQTNTDLKFYFQITAKSKDELFKLVRIIKQVGGTKFGLDIQNKVEVTAILKRMANMNEEVV